MRVVGVDPGQDEAAAIVGEWDASTSRLRPLVVASLSRSTQARRKGWVVTTWTDGIGNESTWTPSYSVAVQALVCHPSAADADAAIVEGALWTAREKRTAASIASLSVARGRILQELHSVTRIDAAEPLAEVWRRVVLLTSQQTSGEAAKGLAVAHVTGRRELRRLPIPWSCVWPDGVPCRSHEAEAVCLAVYGALTVAGR